jgi:hypothetical protein
MKVENLKQVQVKYKEEYVHRHIELTAVPIAISEQIKRE